MKKLYPYDKFISEGLRDKMTPKPKEDVMKILDDMYNEKEDYISYSNTYHNLYQMLTTLWLQGDKQERKRLEKRYPRFGLTFQNLSDGLKRRMNESLRDKMSPISKVDAKKAYNEIIKNFEPISKDNSLVIGWGIIGMLKFMGETKDSMCLVMAGDNYFEALDSFFWSLVEDKDKKVENEWLYWKDLKLTYSLVPCARWMFSNDIDYTNLNINEGIRDKMTPKSEEDSRTEFLKKRKGEMAISLYIECIETFYPDAPHDSTPIINDKFCDFLKNEIGFDVWKSFVPTYKQYITFDMVLDDLTREQLIKIFEFLYDKKLNESLRDKMTPKPKTEIEQQISHLPIKARIEFISNNRLFDIYSDDEFFAYFKTLPQDELDSFLVYCVMSKRMNAIRILLDCGANPNGIGPFKLTPLYHAVQGSITSHPDVNVIKLLLDSGGDPTFANQRGLTALGHAETWKKPEISELLKQYVKTNESVKDKMTPKSKEDIDDVFKDMTDEQKKEMMLKFIKRENLEMMLIMLNNGMKVTPYMKRVASEYHNLAARSLLDWIGDKQKMNESIRDKMTPISDEKMKELRSLGKAATVINNGYSEKQAKKIIKKYSSELNKSIRFTKRNTDNFVCSWVIPSTTSVYGKIYVTLDDLNKDGYIVNFQDNRTSTWRKIINGQSSEIKNDTDFNFRKMFMVLEDALNFLIECGLDINKINIK